MPGFFMKNHVVNNKECGQPVCQALGLWENIENSNRLVRLKRILTFV